MHLIVALLKAGQRVAAIDLDSRQLSLARYIENRRRWARRIGADLELPTVHAVRRANGDSVEGNEGHEFAAFAEAVADVEHSHDFVVIDTPASDSYLMRLAHSMADTLVTPLNDSFVDFDVLGQIDPESRELVAISHYADMVRASRRQRRMVDNGLTDWIAVRNRMSSLDSRNQRAVADSLTTLADHLGFRIADGISERVVYREFFPCGLTALDNFDDHVQGTRTSLSHVAARQEVKALMETLRLPLDTRGRERAEARATFLGAATEPLDMLDIVD